MGRYTTAVAIISSSIINPTLTASFHLSPSIYTQPPSTNVQSLRQQRRRQQHNIIPRYTLLASLSPTDDGSFYSSNQNNGDITSVSTNEQRSSSLSNNPPINDDDDDDIDTQSRLKTKSRNQLLSTTHLSSTYEITIPLSAKTSTTPPIGLYLVHIRNGQPSSYPSPPSTLNLDTLRYENPSENNDDTTSPVKSEFLDFGRLADDVGEDFGGLVVSRVVKGGVAWREGVRVGDVLLATSATIGDQMWDKSTLEGVRSAISSRKVMNSDTTIRFGKLRSRVGVSQVAETFELVLRRPIGIEINDAPDGFVQISGFTSDVTPETTKSLRIGDRITAVDSSLGTKMWPVSTVEGLMSSCTSRLPGQPIRFQFERIVSVGDYDTSTSTTSSQQQDAAGDGSSVSSPDATASLAGAVDGFRRVTNDTASSSASAAGSNTHKLLLSRCRDVLRRYNTPASTSTLSSSSSNARTAMSAVPTIVADRVLETLAEASAPLDARTLTLIMNSYLTCRQPEKAMMAFEGAVGWSADGSEAIVEAKDLGKGLTLVSDSSALNLFVGTSLLQAHALSGDYSAARRVLAAMEGRSVEVDGVMSCGNWVLEDGVMADTRCYNIVLAAAAKAGGADAIEVAVELFDAMKVTKTAVSYNTIIGLFAKEGRLQDALTVFYDMKFSKIRPDKFTYTSLLKALVNSRDFTGARELIQEMKDNGIAPDIVTYNTLIKGLCDNFKWYEAKALVTDMESLGVSPNSMTYGLLMNGLLKTGNPSACVTLFESAYSDERTTILTENVYLYTTAISAASRMGDYERAIDLLGRMKIVGVKPTMKTLTALMGACLSAGRGEEAVKVFKTLLDNTKGLVADGRALSLGVRAYCEVGDFEKAAGIVTEQRDGLGRMRGKEVMFCYNYIIEVSLNGGKYEVAMNAFTELLQSGYIPSKQLYKTIIKSLGLIRRSNYKIISSLDTGNSVVDEMKRFDFLLFVLDSINKRNLECDAYFYITTLQEGAHIGKLARKISSLIVEARLTYDKDANTPTVVGYNDINWRDILKEMKNGKQSDDDAVANDNEAVLPTVRVRISNKELKQVLNSERLLSFGSQKRRKRARTGRQGGSKWTASSAGAR